MRPRGEVDTPVRAADVRRARGGVPDGRRHAGFFAPPIPRLIAHRGASGTCPENTLAAFRAAALAGAEMFELDLHLSADRVPVVIHDPTLERTTGADGPVAARTAADLGALDAGYRFTPDGGRSFPWRGAGEGVPCLAEVLAAFPSVRMTLEIKTASAALDDPLGDVLEAAGALGRVLLASFDGPTIRRMRAGFPGVPTNFSAQEVARFVRGGALAFLRHRPRRVPEAAAALQVPSRVRWRTLVTRPFVAAAHAAGVEVHVWTVNDRPAMERLLELGVDGVMTDHPARLLEVYRSRGLR